MSRSRHSPRGDVTRDWPPFDTDESLYSLSTNRNKRSVALDLRHAEGRGLLARLVARADVLVKKTSDPVS